MNRKAATSPIAASTSTAAPPQTLLRRRNTRKQGEMLDKAKAPSLAEMRPWRRGLRAPAKDLSRPVARVVIIRSTIFRTDEVLDEMEAESEFDLLGCS